MVLIIKHLPARILILTNWNTITPKITTSKANNETIRFYVTTIERTFLFVPLHAFWTLFELKTQSPNLPYIGH